MNGEDSDLYDNLTIIIKIKSGFKLMSGFKLKNLLLHNRIHRYGKPKLGTFRVIHTDDTGLAIKGCNEWIRVHGVHIGQPTLEIHQL